MKKKLLNYAAILGVVAILFYACKKERSASTYQPVKTTEGNTKLHTLGGPYIDEIYISNPGHYYVDYPNYYDTIYTYHTNTSSTIHVTVTSLFNGNAVYYGSETFILSPSHPSHTSYGLENALISICSRNGQAGLAFETYNISITRVTDENDNDITDQVLLVPGSEGINAHVQGTCFGIDSTKCQGCQGLSVKPVAKQ